MFKLKESMHHLLPPDDELVRREKLFLNLFDKFSVDEGSDPELDDSAGDEPEDNSDSGSSFSEASSNESGSDDSSVINKMKEDLQPVIKDRVNAWPEKGINLQLKTIDSSVTVEDWLKANNEFTTTTKKYKKTVVSEKHKTVTTTTKQTKTTTKRSSVQSFIPSFLYKAVNNVKKLGNEVKAITNDSADLVSKSEKNVSGLQHQTKRKDKVKPNIDKNHTKIDFIAKNKIAITANPADSYTKEKSRKEVPKNQEAVKSSSMNLRSNAMVLPLENGTTRFLRPREPRKENTASVVSSKKQDNNLKQIKSKERNRDENAEKKQSKSMGLRNHTKQDKLRQNDVKVKDKMSKSADLPSESGRKQVAILRSPLKEKTLNRITRQVNLIEKHPQIKKVQVNLKKIQPTHKNTLAKPATNSLQEMRANTEIVSNYDDTISNSNIEAHKSATDQSQKQSHRQSRPRKRQIVIHSPGSKMLGKKLDDKFMLVKKRDYKKRIHPKDFRSMDNSIINDSIVPINQRIVYIPPTTIFEGSSDDSECDDVLLTSYMNTGHFLHINLK